MSEVVAGIVGAVVGSGLTVLGGVVYDEFKRRRAKRDVGVQDLERYYVRLSTVRRWLVDNTTISNKSELQKHASEYGLDLYALWDQAKQHLNSDSVEVNTALETMNIETEKVFQQIAQGNYSPDLARFDQQRDRLEAVVRDRMKVKL